MKVTQTTLSDKGLEEREWSNVFQVHINDELALEVYDGEPEDNNLNRNFKGCYKITNLMKQAYEAGKNGETFEVEEKKIDNLD